MYGTSFACLVFRVEIVSKHMYNMYIQHAQQHIPGMDWSR